MLTDHRPRPPTLHDVAQHAGVSHTTVSRVINGGPVSMETAARVHAAMAELGYQLNTAARALAHSRNQPGTPAGPPAELPDPGQLAQENRRLRRALTTAIQALEAGLDAGETRPAPAAENTSSASPT